MKFRILVCGGRFFRDREGLFRTLDSFLPETAMIITGAQRIKVKSFTFGADFMAEEWARARAVPYVGHPAQWDKYGDAAGPIRNAEMQDLWMPQRIIAFPGGKGTYHMVSIAKCPVVKVGW